MKRFLSRKFASLVPYVPGEQPRERKFIKLNTNESPFPPSPTARAAAKKAAVNVQLYSDPECSRLRAALASHFGVGKENVICANGSDEVLNFAFAAFCDRKRPAVFCDVTYGFYKVFARFNRVPATVIPLKDDLSVDVDAMCAAAGTLFVANPNAPTGIVLGINEIRRMVGSDPERVVVIDEAYVDFGAESCVGLIKDHPNLLVTQTFSKSRSMAGARLGFGIGSEELISALETLRYSTNPYNVNSMTLAMGAGALDDEKYTQKNCAEIARNREFLKTELKKSGFFVTDSKANFVFCRHERLTGEEIYAGLRERGVLVRHFGDERIKDFNRITVGTAEQCRVLLAALEEMIGGKNENV